MAATAMMWGCDAVKAQTLEPEFEGEVVGVFPDGSSKKLEKHNVRMRTGAGVYIAGFAASKSKTKVLVEGGSASVRFDAAQPIALIVRAKDNKADPMSIVRVFRMKSTKKNRSAVISAVGSFSVNSNTMDYLRFSAEKYGESSYRLTFDERPAGEYGIIVSNPNNVDEKMVIVRRSPSTAEPRRKSKPEPHGSDQCGAERFCTVFAYRGAGKEPVRIETSSVSAVQMSCIVKNPRMGSPRRTSHSGIRGMCGRCAAIIEN